MGLSQNDHAPFDRAQLPGEIAEVVEQNLQSLDCYVTTHANKRRPGHRNWDRDNPARKGLTRRQFLMNIAKIRAAHTQVLCRIVLLNRGI